MTDKKRTLAEVNADYNKLCLVMGDAFVKLIFGNKEIIAKYAEFKLLKNEADELESIAAEEKRILEEYRAKQDELNTIPIEKRA